MFMRYKGGGIGHKFLRDWFNWLWRTEEDPEEAEADIEDVGDAHMEVDEGEDEEGGSTSGGGLNEDRVLPDDEGEDEDEWVDDDEDHGELQGVEDRDGESESEGEPEGDDFTTIDELEYAPLWSVQSTPTRLLLLTYPYRYPSA
jgi:hypothetical protein